MSKESGYTTPTKALFLASNTLGDIAFAAAEACRAEPNQHIVAAFFSAAWFEAMLNEIMYEVLEGRDAPNAERLTRIKFAAEAAGIDERMVSIGRRLRVLAVAATDQPLPETTQPWRDVLLLFRLRNHMVHLRPELMRVRAGRDDEPSTLVSDPVHELVTDLEATGAIRELPAGRLISVVTAAQLDGVGKWSYTAAYRGLEALESWMPGPSRRRASQYRTPEHLESTV